MIEVEVANRSAAVVDEPGAVALAREVLAGRGSTDGRARDRVRRCRTRCGRSSASTSASTSRPTSSPSRSTGSSRCPPGEPRALGDVVLCPDVVGDDWRWPLVHGLLHLLGHEHGYRDGGARARACRRRVIARRARRRRSIIESFNYAIEGIIHVLRTQRNMRIHFAIAIGVLVAALAFDVSRLELIALLLAIAFVLIAEMVNTAIEAAVDVASTSFDPMAKLAKDIGAGAVLIAAVNAIAVGYLVFSGQVADESSRLLDRLSEAPAELTLVALVLTTALVIAMKALSGRGSPLRGGWPSGHAAVAFAGWMAVTLLLDDTEHRFLVSSLALIMALLVAQTRIEAGVHSTLEVALGRAARGARDARRLPGVLRVTDAELLAAADAIAARAYAPYSKLPRRLRGSLPRRPGRRGRQRRERRVPARRLRGAHRVLPCDGRGLPPRRLRARRDHGVALRRVQAMAGGDGRRAGRVPERWARRGDDSR